MQNRRQRVRTNPQLSLSLLGEYIVAGFARKKSILREAKYPPDYIGPRYDPAQKAAARYLARGGGDREQLERDLQEMLTGSSRSKWFREREKLCHQAISCVLALESELNLGQFDVALGNDVRHRMTIGGVVVSVYPDLILRGTNRKGPFIAALKFRYGKTKTVSAEWGAYSATILHQFVERHLAGEECVAERRCCCIVDVFAGKRFEAPDAFKNRRKDVEAACWNIKNVWDTVGPRDLRDPD